MYDQTHKVSIGTYIFTLWAFIVCTVHCYGRTTYLLALCIIASYTYMTNKIEVAKMHM